MYILKKIFTVIIILNLPLLSLAQDDCQRKIQIAKYQLGLSIESEKRFKEIYEDAKRDNIISTSILIPSAIAFSTLGTMAVVGGSTGGVSTFAMTFGAPGVHLAMRVSEALKFQNIVIPMVLGWASQASPGVYALGHGAYRLIHNDKILDLSKIQIAVTINELDASLAKLSEERSNIFSKSKYSQLMDGLLLGSLDRQFTLNLYNNSIASRIVTDAKLKLLNLQCQ